MSTPRHSDHNDDISVTSTPPSEPQDEYEVERVLAERDFDTQVMYLVKWAGYPLDRCTWEPEDSFCDPQTLEEWRVKKEAITQEKEAPFDVDALIEKIQAIEYAAALRKQRRKEKRIRLGMPVSSDDSSADEGEEDEQGLDGFIVSDGDVEKEGARNTPKRKVEDKQKEKTRVPPVNDRAYSHNPAVDKPASSTKTVKKNAPKFKSLSTSRTEPNSTSKAPSTQRKSPSAAQNVGSSQPIQKSRLWSQPSTNSEIQSTTTIFEPRPLLSARKRVPVPANDVTDSSQPNRNSTSTNSVFPNLSSQRRYEKAMRRDREPDISQLDLRAPTDWLSQPNKPDDISQSPSKGQENDTDTDMDSLFVEQDSPEPQHGSSHVDSAHNHRVAAGKEGTRDNDHDNSKATNYPMNSAPRRSGEKPSKKRFWQPSEVLATLKLGAVDMTVGDVRICGLNPTNARLLVKLKSKHRILIDFRDVCTYDEYGELCKTGYNTTYANGFCIGFEDTAPALSDMTRYLRERDLAALWYHPEEEAQLVLVAYPAGSPIWSFLDNNVPVNSTQGLRVVARGTLPPFSSIGRVWPPIMEPQPAEPPSFPAEMSNENSHHVDGVLHTTPDHSPLTPHMPLPPQNSDALSVENFDIVELFREKYGIGFQELSKVKTKKGAERVRAFYLHFPDKSEGINNEFRLVEHFLERHNIKAFSNRQSGDWERFVTTATSGTILFHQSYIFYENMPDLSKKILQSSFNIFNISLDRCIEGSEDSHLQRLFPSGGVVLMTEDFMIHETVNAIAVLEWFGGFVQVTSEWKLFFRPNIQQWLFNLFDTWPDDKMYQIYCWINHHIPQYPQSHYNFHKRCGSPDSLDGLTDDEGQHHPFISMRTLPGYGSRSETEHEAIPKGLSQEERNTDHLVEYFGGWALMNCHKYRKFFVLTHFKPQPRWKEWNHLTITNGEEFLKHLDNRKRHKSKDHGNTRASPSVSSKPSDRRLSSDKNMPPPPRPPPQRPPPDPRIATQHPSQPPSTPANSAVSPSDMMDID